MLVHVRQAMRCLLDLRLKIRGLRIEWLFQYRVIRQPPSVLVALLLLIFPILQQLGPQNVLAGLPSVPFFPPILYMRASKYELLCP